MALPNKPGSVVLGQSANELPPFDVRFPGEVIERFPKLQETQRQLATYHELVKKVLTRLIDEQNRARATVQSTMATLESVQTALAAQVNALAAVPDAVVAPVDLTPLLTALDAHIEATAAHGTVGDIVGTTDEQALEAKTIGFNYPRQGRFRSALNRSDVEITETLRIPSGYTHVVVGPFTVHGQLIVEGEMMVL